jgi:AraC family transcriptional regulator
MGIARDGLRNLLDALAESVETGGTGEEVAARVHVSRFHFDRIVRAALDETPGVFRRRLLLERAAHSLAGGASVGEASLEAGYVSPEAFARAFRQAHGVAPSAFAGSGLPFRLAAPNGIHFHPPGALVVAGGERSDTMDLADRLLEHDLWLTGRLLDAADELPADALGEPLDVEGETLGSMLERLVWSKEMWTAAVDGRPMPERREGSPECLRKRLGEAGPAFVEIVFGAGARGAWDTAFIDATCEPPESFTYGGMAAHVLTWSAYRRKVVLDALRRHGVEVEHADPLGWERSEKS